MMVYEKTGRRGRMTIGIYNAYDPKTFREPHRRVIARAGDLAMAFNMNLALFGFPIPEDWTANVCFGGRERNILFITASKSVYTLKMLVHGVN